MTSHNKRSDGLSPTRTGEHANATNALVNFGFGSNGVEVGVMTTDYNNKQTSNLNSFYPFFGTGSTMTTDFLHTSSNHQNNNKVTFDIIHNNNNSSSRISQSTYVNDIPFFSTTTTSNGFSGSSSSFPSHPQSSSSLSPYTTTTWTTRPYGDPMKNPTNTMSLNTIMDMNHDCYVRHDNNNNHINNKNGHHHQEEKLMTTSVHNNNDNTSSSMMMTVRNSTTTSLDNKKTRLVGAGISLTDNDTNHNRDNNDDHAMIMRVDHHQTKKKKNEEGDGRANVSSSYTKNNNNTLDDHYDSSNHFGDSMFNMGQQQQLHQQQKLLSQTAATAAAPTPTPTPFAQMSQFLHNTSFNSRGVPILRYKQSNNNSSMTSKKNDAAAVASEDQREAIRFGTLLVKPGYEQEGVLAGKIRKVLTLRQPGCLWVEQVLRVDDSHNGLFRLLQISAWDSDTNMDIFNDGYESKSFWKNYIDMAVPSSFYWIEYYRVQNPFVLTFQLGCYYSSNSSRKTHRRTKNTSSSQNRRCSASTQKTSNSNNSTTTSTSGKSTSAASSTTSTTTTSAATDQQQEDEISNDNVHPTSSPLDDNVIKVSGNFSEENDPFKDKAVALSVWIEVTPLTTQLDLFYKLLLLSEACAIQEEGCLRYVIMTERTKKKKKKTKNTTKKRVNDETTTASMTQHDVSMKQRQKMFLKEESITGVQKTSNRRNKRPRFTIYAVFKNELSYQFHSSQGYSVLSERLRAMCLKPTPTTTIFTRNPLCVF